MMVLHNNGLQRDQPKIMPSVCERSFGSLVIEAEGRKDVLFGFWLKME